MRHTALNWIISILAGVYICTLFVYAGAPSFNAPDENATAVFIERVQATGVPRIPFTNNASVLNVLHPRSTTVVGDFIVPIGFLGMPFWYGVVSMPLPGAVFFLTPALVVLALGAWYALMKTYLESPRLALYATVLLATLPPFWYYAARGFMPNVPFVCLLILAFTFFDLKPWKERCPWWLYGVLSGMLFGVAVSFRFFELPWIVALVAAYVFVKRSALQMKDVALFVCGACLTLLPILSLQHIVYGSPFTVGYTVQNDISYKGVDPVLDEIAAAFAPSPIVASQSWSNVVFPFGIHERLIVTHVFENVFLLMPLFALFATLGWLLAWKEKQTHWRPLAASVAMLAVWLFVIYGSWNIADNPDPLVVTLANSYSRYWLPVYLLAIPFVVIGMDRLTTMLFKKHAELGLSAFIVAWVLFGAISVLHGPDGLIATRARLYQFAEDRTVLLNEIPSDARVITYYADKYLYPERVVAIGLTTDAVIHAMPQLLAQAPLYYFGITLPSTDMEFYQRTLLDRLPVKYRLTPVLQLRDQTLYRYDLVQDL